MTDLNPTLSWTYHCNPDAYLVTLSRMARPYPVFVEVVEEIDPDMGGPSLSWTVEKQLEPATHYLWRVRPLISAYKNEALASAQFWTGPHCDPAALAAPPSARSAALFQ